MKDDIDAIVEEALAATPAEIAYSQDHFHNSLAEYSDDELISKAAQLHQISEGMAPYSTMRQLFLQMSESLGMVIKEGRRRGIEQKLLDACGRTRW